MGVGVGGVVLDIMYGRSGGGGVNSALLWRGGGTCEVFCLFRFGVVGRAHLVGRYNCLDICSDVKSRGKVFLFFFFFSSMV